MSSRSGSGLANRGYARDEFFDVVRRGLADVPWSKRQELLAQVAQRLDALPARTRPEDVLGEPQRYARLIREAEGLPPDRVPRFPYWRAMRLRNKVLVITVPLLIVVANVISAYVHTYQPLTASQDLTYSSAPAINDPLAREADFFRYQNGATVVSGISLTNTGWATVTVTGVVMVDGSPFSLIGFRSQSNPRLIGLWDRATPVSRLAVHPGERIELYVVMKMRPYELDRGGSVVVDQPPLVVQVLGVTHQLRPTGSQIGVVG